MRLSPGRACLFFLPLAALAFWDCPRAQAHDLITTRLTWTEQISRIFEKRCVSCHREGGSAPMPLETYEQVRPWAKAIKYQVLNRSMPPWGALKGYGSFRNDLSLSEDDIAKISSWVEGGTPEGNATFLAHGDHEIALHGPEHEPGTESLMLPEKLVLDRDVTALAVSPQRIPEGVSMQATAYLPDGRVEPLIYLREYQAKWQRTYWFREPLALPKGTKIRLYAREPAVAKLLVQP